MNKYILTDETVFIGGKVLRRIKSLKSFSCVCKGDLGGFIENFNNLSNLGDAWVSGDAKVSGNANVSGGVIVKTKDLLVLGPIGSNRFITVNKSLKTITDGFFNGSFNEFKLSVDSKYCGVGDYYFWLQGIELYLGE